MTPMIKCETQWTHNKIDPPEAVKWARSRDKRTVFAVCQKCADAVVSQRWPWTLHNQKVKEFK